MCQNYKFQIKLHYNFHIKISSHKFYPLFTMRKNTSRLGMYNLRLKKITRNMEYNIHTHKQLPYIKMMVNCTN